MFIAFTKVGCNQALTYVVDGEKLGYKLLVRASPVSVGMVALQNGCGMKPTTTTFVDFKRSNETPLEIIITLYDELLVACSVSLVRHTKSGMLLTNSSTAAFNPEVTCRVTALP